MTWFFPSAQACLPIEKQTNGGQTTKEIRETGRLDYPQRGQLLFRLPNWIALLTSFNMLKELLGLSGDSLRTSAEAFSIDAAIILRA